MKKLIAFSICVIMLLSLWIPAFADVPGIQLPDVQVGGKDNEGDAGSGGNQDGGGTIDPDSNANPGSTAFEKLTDVSADAWYYDEIKYVVDNGLFAGVSETEFLPLKAMTRAEFVQVLSQLENIDVSDKNVDTDFIDVNPGNWFAPAVKWASDNNIVKGMGNGFFKPNTAISREEMCVMLVNYIAYKGIQVTKVEDKEEFKDDAQISDWASDRVYACQMADIINGKGGGIFDPQATAIRAEVATMFAKFYMEYKDQL